MRQEFFLGFFVEVFERFAAGVLVLGEVERTACCNPFEFLRAEGEIVENVGAGAGVVSQFVFFVDVAVHAAFRQSDFAVPFQALGNPVFVLFGVGAGLDEEFEFHLFELARAESVVARVDFVAERFADLRDAERYFLARDGQDVGELREDALRGFGAEPRDVGAVFHRADEGFEHQVEGARLGERAGFIGVGADEFVVGVERDGGERNGFVVGGVYFGLFRLFLRSFFVLGVGKHQCGGIGFVFEDENLVGAVATLGFAAVEHRVFKVADMAGSFPDFGVHDDGAVEADDVFAALDGGFPPAFFDVALQFDAERAVVPEAVNAAVDFRGLENKAAALAERGQSIHRD